MRTLASEQVLQDACLLLRHGATFDDRIGQSEESGSLWALWMARDHRASIVAAALYGVVKRDLRKLGHAELLSESLSSPLTEWMGCFAAVLTYVVAHVLNQAEHGYFDLSEHLKPLLGIYEGKLAGRRDDDGTR